MAFALFSGGPHDRERIAEPRDCPFPERLIGIGFRDGAEYAKVGETVERETRETIVLLRFDDDGSLTRAVKLAVGISPDAPTTSQD